MLCVGGGGYILATFALLVELQQFRLRIHVYSGGVLSLSLNKAKAQHFDTSLPPALPLPQVQHKPARRSLTAGECVAYPPGQEPETNAFFSAANISRERPWMTT